MLQESLRNTVGLVLLTAYFYGVPLLFMETHPSSLLESIPTQEFHTLSFSQRSILFPIGCLTLSYIATVQMFREILYPEKQTQ